MRPSRQSSVVSRQPGVHVVAVVRGAERYVVLYDDQHRREVGRTIERWAADPELSFTWYDAACVAQKLRATPAKSGGE